MAEYIKLDYDIDRYDDSIFIGDQPQINILCDNEIEIERFQDPLFESFNFIRVYQLPPSREMGSGGIEGVILPELNQLILTGVRIAIGMTVAGFFGYFGSELAKALISKLKKLDKVSHITASGPSYHLEITVPANLTEEDCLVISNELNKLSIDLQQNKTHYLHITYDKDTKKVVKIEEIDDKYKHI